MRKPHHGNREEKAAVMTEQELDEIVTEIVRRRLASPEFADLQAVMVEAERIGTRIEALPRRRREGRPATLHELTSLIAQLYRHQATADRVFREAMQRARA